MKTNKLLRLLQTKFLVAVITGCVFCISANVFAGSASTLHLNEVQKTKEFKQLQANSDTSTLDIMDSLKTYASHRPSVERFADTLREFHSLVRSYTDACHHETEEWMEDYSSEAEEFFHRVQKFFEVTDIDSLTYSQKEIYYDLKAQWVMVAHGHHDHK